MIHEEFRSVKGEDGLWRAECKTVGCGYVGPARDHVLDTGEDCIAHMEQTSEDPS